MPVEREQDGHVLVLTLNRPEVRNALDPDTILSLGGQMHAALDDNSVRAVVLTGAGGAFCSGMDLKVFAARGRDARPEIRHGLDVVLRRDFPKPLLAAVDGPAVAGGFELVLASDLVVASDRATFGMPEAARGLVGAGCSTRLAQRVPIALAMEVGLTAERFSAHRAMSFGLVNRVVPPEQVRTVTVDLATRISRHPPESIHATKRIMLNAIGREFAAARNSADEIARSIFASESARQGARSFIEHGPEDPA